MSSLVTALGSFHVGLPWLTLLLGLQKISLLEDFYGVASLADHLRRSSVLWEIPQYLDSGWELCRH